MIRRAARPQRNFSIYDNALINDERISYRAWGVLSYVLSKPDNWRINRDQLARGAGREGVSAIRTVLKELEANGYLVRRRIRTEDGKFGWEQVVYDQPVSAGETTGRNPSDGSPPVDNPPSKQELTTNDGHQDVLECPAPPSSVRAPQKFEDWRAEDRALFKSIVGDTMTSNGSTWNKGTYTADAWYDGLHKHKTRPMKWPGRFVQALQDRDGLYEYFTEYGIEPAA